MVRPRQIAMYLSKLLTPRSLPEIGRQFGGRDHTTVLHAVRKITGLVTTDATLSEEIELFESVCFWSEPSRLGVIQHRSGTPVSYDVSVGPNRRENSPFWRGQDRHRDWDHARQAIFSSSFTWLAADVAGGPLSVLIHRGFRCSFSRWPS